MYPHIHHVTAALHVLLLHVHLTVCALPPSLSLSHQPPSNQLTSHTDNDRGPRQLSGNSESSFRFKSPWNHDAVEGAGSHSRQLQHWATAAYNFVHSLDCQHVFFTTYKECRTLVSIPKQHMTIHVAAPSPYGKFRSAIPEESVTGSGLHHAVLAVNPHPRASFGHVVIVFFLDLRVSRSHCQNMGGLYLDGDECMHLALRRRCRNALERLSRRRNYARRCEINFLPVVHLSTRGSHPHPNPNPHPIQRNHEDRNHLECKSELAGFGKCPALRSEEETAGVVCDHLRDNTRRCSTTHDSGVRSSCRMFEVCDQAVLISGGWNRQTSGPRQVRNLEAMLRMLRHHGFKKRNVKVFFANGAPPLQVEGESDHRVFPAALKVTLRNHLRRLCSTPHCVDSLLIYLNSPAMGDGTALLWDTDQDGLVSSNERYTVSELKSDLADCSAKQVTILVDQSFSGELVHEFRRSPHHRNVLVFASGKSGEYSYDDELTTFWASWNDTRACATDIHAASRSAVTRSSPRMGEGGEEGRAHTTIFGAPCHVRPPFTPRELRHNYLGCQNLPTHVWLSHILRNSPSELLHADNDDDDDDEDGDDEDYDEEEEEEEGDELN